MTMKNLTALFILTCIISCGQATDKQPPNLKINKKETSLTTQNQNGDRWHFKKYLNDPSTPQLAKNIFNNNWKLKGEEPLNYLEKLHGQDKEARPFYFRVVTNSKAQADGAYSEGLGNAGYEYVQSYPDEFSNYFLGQDAFTDQDLKTWADIVISEFEIIGENEYDKPLIKNYLEGVGKNCKDCSAQQKDILEKFGRYLNEKWSKYLKHIDK